MGYTDVLIEGRFNHLRSGETNLADFAADILRTEYETDFSLINSGTLRSNALFDRGPIK
jgi:5'-nucleotidase